MNEGLSGDVGEPLLTAIPWLDQILLVGVASARFAFSFVFVPIFSREVMPATVRNSIIVTFGLVALAMRPDFAPANLSAAGWLLLLMREVAAGAVIGFFFGTVMWAMAAAGEIIDTKVGATMAQLVDPLSGTHTSLNGILLGRFAQVIFVSMGGLTLMIGTVMQSYLIWPMGTGALNLEAGSVVFFEGELGRLFAWAFFFSMPAITILYIVDLALGFLNRFAQQFNVFMLSLPIKSVAATMIIIMLLPLLAQAVIADMASREGVAGGMLQRTASEQGTNEQETQQVSKQIAKQKPDTGPENAPQNSAGENVP
ncbi:MAG: type III secretion system export apparatus subunit SctT [Sphingomonadales bacterium]|nr:type III secretion system export apparatus subunit SctT [Sphingomonadales bacterium]